MRPGRKDNKTPADIAALFFPASTLREQFLARLCCELAAGTLMAAEPVATLADMPAGLKYEGCEPPFNPSVFEGSHTDFREPAKILGMPFLDLNPGAQNYRAIGSSFDVPIVASEFYRWANAAGVEVPAPVRTVWPAPWRARLAKELLEPIAALQKSAGISQGEAEKRLGEEHGIKVSAIKKARSDSKPSKKNTADKSDRRLRVVKS